MEKEGTIMSKDFRLTIELVPRPCWYSNMRTTIPRAAWDKLRKQVYAQYNYCCGVCQLEHVTLHCHEIWQYDDTLHSQKLNGFIALCEMWFVYPYVFGLMLGIAPYALFVALPYFSYFSYFAYVFYPLLFALYCVWPFLLAGQLIAATAMLFQSRKRLVGLGIFTGLALFVLALFQRQELLSFLLNWPPSVGD